MRRTKGDEKVTRPPTSHIHPSVPQVAPSIHECFERERSILLFAVRCTSYFQFLLKAWKSAMSTMDESEKERASSSSQLLLNSKASVQAKKELQARLDFTALSSSFTSKPEDELAALSYDRWCNYHKEHFPGKFPGKCCGGDPPSCKVKHFLASLYSVYSLPSSSCNVLSNVAPPDAGLQFKWERILQD
ncbi:hypothetical protein Y032_0229g2915 [Ancylostoma ceylanicum]|nr:hypothetical protein Y032_0229g2915 [Ancylostoma ceylanicum]